MVTASSSILSLQYLHVMASWLQKSSTDAKVADKLTAATALCAQSLKKLEVLCRQVPIVWQTIPGVLEGPKGP